MADADKIETRHNYFWIHNVFGNFVKDTMDYFADYLYPRFQWQVVGTYDKAVEYYNKHVLYNRETDQPQLPGLILDPSGDFGLDETYGKMFYRFPNLAPGQAKYVYNPIYQDQHVLMTVAFNRFIGELNFIGLMSSFYEYYDMRVFLNLIFGGQDRIIHPRWFTSFIIIPPEIQNYRYQNDATGLTYRLNIENSYDKLVRTTNTNELVYPCTIKPLYKLTGMSDSSTRLGGTTNLPDWKLSFTVSYEIELPTWIILESDYLAEKAKISINYESCYTANEVYSVAPVPVDIDRFDVNVDHGLDSTSNSEIVIPTEATISDYQHLTFKTRYYYIVTDVDATSTTYIDVNMPETVTDPELLKLNSKIGILPYWDVYTLINGGTIMRIDVTKVSISKGDILEIYIYGYV
jgi:hypothetical protein